MASDHPDNHGKSVASWTAVCIELLAAVLIGVGIMFNQHALAWIGAVLVVVGVIAGAGLTAAGFASAPHKAPELRPADVSQGRHLAHDSVVEH